MDPIQPPRKLFCITFACLVLLATSTYFIAKTQLPPSITINTQGQPTIGYPKARVHVVVFEEPKCSHCQELNNDLFPTIKKEFIDTNKIRYTVIPVSFLPGSMPAAVAALCVYHQNPLYPNDELFFKYLDHIYRAEKGIETDWAYPRALLGLARATSPAIQLDKLQYGIEREQYRDQVEANTAYGKQLMGGTVLTPTVYVNGIMVREISIEEIRKLIHSVLAHEGVE